MPGMQRFWDGGTPHGKPWGSSATECVDQFVAWQTDYGGTPLTQEQYQKPADLKMLHLRPSGPTAAACGGRGGGLRQDHGLAWAGRNPAGSFGFAFKWRLLNPEHTPETLGFAWTFAMVMSNWTIELPLAIPSWVYFIDHCVGSMSLFTL